MRSGGVLNQGVSIFILITLVLAGQNAISQESNFLEDSHYLDVSISIFAMNLPAEERQQKILNIYPQVRAAEARYMPALLRATLQNSEKWGAIRIVPELDPGSDLMISGSIVRSDGALLAIDILAIDSTGFAWINNRYQAESADAGISLMQPDVLIDPFQTLYNQVQNDLFSIYEQLEEEQLLQIKSVSLLRYATVLAPDSFNDYLVKNESGIYGFTRLPANNDPLLKRVEEIRQHGYLFIDVVDEQYQRFLISIKPVYDLWREYSVELEQNSLDYEVRQESNNGFDRGSYLSLKDSYNNYKWEKMQEQYLDELAAGFSNEVVPTEIDLEDTIYQLSGTMENQYLEWQEILKNLFELEAL